MKVKNASPSPGTFRERKTSKIRSTSRPNGRPVRGSRPSRIRRRNSSPSWTTASSTRSAAREVRISLRATNPTTSENTSRTT
jgi:hypothetical protein